MSSVIVKLGELHEAASKYGRLNVGPGFRGSVPRTTEIKPDKHGILIETPHMEISVSAQGKWSHTVSVDCKTLHKALGDLRKRWKDIGGDEALVTLSTTPNALQISWSDGRSSRSFSIPAWPPKAPS